LATALQFGDELTVERPQEVAPLRVMAQWYFASFWLIVFTGAIRKWVTPGVTVLYLLQDVPIGLAYLYAIWKGFFDRGYMLLVIIVLSTVLTLQGIIQIVATGLPLLVAIVGLHNYLYYLPMLVVFPICLTEKYRRDFIWWNLIFSIPMCLIAIGQAESPRQAFINRTSEGDAFGLPGVEVARVSGTFNFTVFYGLWVAMAVALCMGEWLLPKERRVFKKQWLLVLCTFTVNLCHLVSGSRSAIALSGASIFGAMVAAFVLRSNRAILAIGGILMLLPVVAGATYLISPVEFNTVADRFTGARYQQDNQDRIVGGLIGFLTIPKFDLLGAGIGMGVDAAHVGSEYTYYYTYDLSEGDTIRNVMELGTPVGLLYVLTRIGFLVGMVFVSIRIVRNGSTPHVLPLAFYLLAQAYQGDLTRAATMTASQVMIGYAFILGAYYYPDRASLEPVADDSLMRYA
jgi:hypothetical protein